MKNFKYLSLVIILSFFFFTKATAKHIDIEGNFIALYIDKQNHGQSELNYYLKTKKRKLYKLKFKNKLKHPEKIKALKLSGDLQGREIKVESFQETEKSKNFRLVNATQSEARANQRTLVIPLLNTSYNTGFLYSSLELNNLFFSSSGTSLKKYFNEVSNSIISFNGIAGKTVNVSGIFNEFTNGLCVPGESLIDGYAWLFALDTIYQEYDLEQYDRVSIVVPNDSLCLGTGVLGVGTLGKLEFENSLGRTFEFSFNFVRSYNEPIGNDDTFVAIAAHEMGHNLGLKHDNANSCGEEIFDSECPSIEYGGAHSIMGYATNLAHINAIHQEDLGWFSSSNEIVNVSRSSSEQTITIAPMASNSTLPKAIKIARGDGSHYMIEYRKPINIASNKAFDFDSDYDGFLVYLNNDSYHNDSILFRADMEDMRPNLNNYSSANNVYYDGLAAQTFSTKANFRSNFIDAVNKIQVIPISLDSDLATLRVVFDGDDSADDSANDGGSDNSGSTSENSIITTVSYPGKATKTSFEPVLNASAKTKLKFTVNFPDSKYRGLKVKIYFGSNIVRHYVKGSKKFKKLTSSSISFPVKFAPENNFFNWFNEYRTEDGYYEIPVTLIIKRGKRSRQYEYTTLKVKSSL